MSKSDLHLVLSESLNLVAAVFDVNGLYQFNLGQFYSITTPLLCLE